MNRPLAFALTCLLLGGAVIQAAPPVQAKGLGDAWSGKDNPVARRFKGDRLKLWSLKKPTRPALPAVKAASWARTPVDRFILARLEGAKLTPSPEADRRTLIRRLSFDLIGLPPTPEEVEAFVADKAPDAYEKLVDRLLADKRYGERWGRHWLDVVRYADTNGFERDEFRVNAWRYRDYVIRAFNEDKPYDRFVKEQLAGDELAGPNPDERGTQAIVATGFLRLGPYDSTAGIFGEDPKGRDQLLADLVNTTGSAFLGLTLACCQCHDHKYDPILQADHFRMRAFFAAVKFRDDLAVDPPPVRAEVEAHNAHLDAQMARLTGEMTDLVKRGTREVQRQRIAEFPAEIRTLLAKKEAEDEATRQKLKPYRDQLRGVNDRVAVGALPEKDRARYDELKKQSEKLKGRKRAFQTAMAMTDSGPNAPPTRIFSGGNINRPTDEVPPGFLSVLDPNPAAIPPPASKRTTGRRTALADWIASPANPWTARVLVNRLWQQHFGRGLVATPNDFGLSGLAPTHPELLDWLAVEFVENGWSIKHLHRRILLSAAYRQTSTVDPRKQVLDSDNALLWRQNVRRLEGEAIRDALLAVSGRLVPKAGGPPVWPALPLEVMLGQPKIFEVEGGRLEGWYADPAEKANARTVYTIQKRSLPLPMLATFDLPDSTCSCGTRTQTTVAPQALALLNSGFAVAMARSFAERLAKERPAGAAARVERAFRLALGRAPDADERKLASELLERQRESHRLRQMAVRRELPEPAAALSPERAALVDLCRALLNLNEFLYVD